MSWNLIGLIFLPIIWFWFLFKYRKNKKEFFKILNPGILFIIVCLLFYFLEK